MSLFDESDLVTVVGSRRGRGHHGLRSPDNLTQPLDLSKFFAAGLFRILEPRSVNLVTVTEPNVQTNAMQCNGQNNTFLHAGCIQTRGDRAAIAFTCPNHNKASGFLNNNLFQTCTGQGRVDEAYNEAFPGCTSDWTKVCMKPYRGSITNQLLIHVNFMSVSRVESTDR